MGLLLFPALIAVSDAETEEAPTLILGAVPWEMAPIHALLTETESGEIHNIPYTKGKLYGLPVIVALTGVSKTNTGMTTGALVTAFNPERVVFSGTGARVKPEIKAGYVFIIEETMFHDAGNLTEAGMESRPVKGPTPHLTREPIFHPDPELFEFAKTLAANYEAIETIQVDGLTYDTQVKPGSIVTGDLFSINQWKYEEIVNKYQTDLFAMETAALGQACSFMEIPWIAFRGGSDLIQAGDASDDYKKYGPIAARQAALFTLSFIEALAQKELP
ncbi:MAG: 5'-methylthioadenosine/S-adenosylhomocysteine nucleosidase [Verrucomicrobiota bacterium]